MLKPLREIGCGFFNEYVLHPKFMQFGHKTGARMVVLCHIPSTEFDYDVFYVEPLKYTGVVVALIWVADGFDLYRRYIDAEQCDKDAVAILQNKDLGICQPYGLDYDLHFDCCAIDYKGHKLIHLDNFTRFYQNE